MRKPFYSFSPARSLSVAALCALVGACSDANAPTAPSVVSHSIGVSSDFSRRGQSPDVDEPRVAVFVIGDAEANDIGATVNFWGAQWWKNNQMSDTVSNGVASFKGFATSADGICGGRWESRPGNSYDPPATIPDDVVVVVTSTVIKDGAAIRGDIKRVLTVHHDGGYGPNPGHAGNGVVTNVVCDGGGIAT